MKDIIIQKLETTSFDIKNLINANYGNPFLDEDTMNELRNLRKEIKNTIRNIKNNNTCDECGITIEEEKDTCTKCFWGSYTASIKIDINTHN
jgi:RNA polymerase-binding transcription factor DksA